MEQLTKKQSDKIVDDLLSRYPSGPKGTIQKHDYTMREMWNSSARVYRRTPVPPVEYFGYDVDTLMMVYWQMNEGDLRGYIRGRWQTIGSKAVARRYNIISERLTPAVQKFKRIDDRGIWNVSDHRKDIKIYVIASSKSTSILLAKTMLAGCGMIVSDHDLYSNRVNVACTSTLTYYSERNLANVKRKLKRSKAKIDELKNNVKNLNQLEETLDNFGGIQSGML